ncbi:MAG: flagellar motor stator protein MotA [Proteobacteria bacterium]|nr:flagellar motor stator protein MotA [Pseudomonadota bacterium]
MVVIGFLITLFMIFGTYILHGGSIDVVLAALPSELATIGGAAIGSFLVANKLSVAKTALKDCAMILKGSKWKISDYTDLFCLLNSLLKLAQQKGWMAIEEDIETPQSSALFQKYPKIASDKIVVSLICDTMRIISLNLDDQNQIEEMMENRLQNIEKSILKSSSALQVTADALPALGIVAAVLGVIKTMSSIDQPPEVLGRMIGSALVGTFLGVFLSYCIVGPVAERIKSTYNKEMNFLLVIKSTILAYLGSNSAQLAIEFGRNNISEAFIPTFNEIEAKIKEDSKTTNKASEEEKV